ncbi:DUF1971 domain-containing protein [Synechococcus sp. 1G10]|uniref:DUF1971 domain-containing protein n=1 Tax=Synechococcus sp. 1G10 TaxID=2025605 RepID=UPI000B9875EA|nr:DUF1971 domain-containing protein [Synechococcus sp. 1G10]
MKHIPDNVSSYRRTPNFTQDTIPIGLLHSHNTKDGVWGKIVVIEGQLRYRILDPDLEEILLGPELSGVVEPTVKHEVEPLGEVRFYVEFYR